ncbi:hypothetical protein BRADI_5g08861v3, partial [Brachypodium distachyon]
NDKTPLPLLSKQRLHNCIPSFPPTRRPFLFPLSTLQPKVSHGKAPRKMTRDSSHATTRSSTHRKRRTSALHTKREEEYCRSKPSPDRLQQPANYLLSDILRVHQIESDEVEQ